MKQVNITAQRLKALEDAERKLTALEVAGVDNWSGYDTALENYRARKRFEAKTEELVEGLLELLCESVVFPAGVDAGPGFDDEAWDAVKEYFEKYAELKEETQR